METSETRPFTAASFYQYLSEKKLMAVRCQKCGALFLPPRAICSQCQGEEMAWVETSGKATLAAFTSIYIGPAFMIEQGYTRDNPYLTGIVEMEEGLKISALLTGFDPKAPQTIEIGTPLQVDFRVHGEGDQQRTFLAFSA